MSSFIFESAYAKVGRRTDKIIPTHSTPHSAQREKIVLCEFLTNKKAWGKWQKQAICNYLHAVKYFNIGATEEQILC